MINRLLASNGIAFKWDLVIDWVSCLFKYKWKMSKQRLFPGYALYLHFVGPGEEYEEGEDIAQEFTVARGTGRVIMRCLNKFGFNIIEVNLFYWSYLTKQILFAVDIAEPK